MLADTLNISYSSKMLKTVLITVLIVINLALGERNIIPSPAVCATLPNEEFAIDFERCQNTCAFYGRTSNCHSDYYKPYGDCYCKRGFARLTEDGACVSVTDNAACKAKLPKTRESCSLNEVFELYITETNARKCLTIGSQIGVATLNMVWGPHCACREWDHRLLRNGNCVHVLHPQCVAEYQPSPKRCSAIGQIYATNAPCQPSCSGETYCPLAGGACICPPGLVAHQYSETYSKVDNNNGQTITQEIPLLQCLEASQCPSTGK